MDNKIFHYSDIANDNIQTDRHDSATIVFTNGCFDILHSGHVQYLQACKQFGDFLIVGLNTDSSIKKIKGPHRPIQSEEDRAIILAGLQCVDRVILFDQDTPLELIKKIRPQVLIKGGDYILDDIVGRDIVIQDGGEVRTIPFVPGKSTSAIIEKIKNLP